MTILVGTSSWTDPTLIKEADFYPSPSMNAEERLRHYSSIFPMVEVDATYYAPPNTRTVELWVERTPANFRMDVKAYSLFTQHPATPRTIWKDVLADLPEEHEGKKSIYLSHLPDEAVDRAWDHLRTALEPLHEAGKLGGVMFQFPPWFTAKRANREYLGTLRDRLPNYAIGVEFRHKSWMSDGDAERTLDLLAASGLSYVCVDEPQGFDSSIPPTLAATAKLAVVRFHGRNAENWQKKGITAAERFRYLYSEDELTEWVEPLRNLAGTAEETHVLMNNCYRDYGVNNARDLGLLLGEGLQPGVSS